ncbi:hypothetical protein [Thalassotalea aquiviva]|uniref:hypothetical protein n=1 Tax=Thalassotalea aquiviva TaxID=3242415 RepID=UPI00352A73C7
MHKGQHLKLLFSKDMTTFKFIEEAISDWQYGFASRASPEQLKSQSGWFIEIPEQKTESSTKAVIDAYLHIRCGLSYFDLDEADMQHWLDSGSQFEVLTVFAEHRELAYQLWKTLSEAVTQKQVANLRVSSVIMTITGKTMPLDEVSFYSSIVKEFGFDLIVNTNFYDDEALANHISLHLALNDIVQNKPEGLDVPAFLRIN